jgi:hypothetical protein
VCDTADIFFFIVFWIFLADDDGLEINVVLGWQQDALVLVKIFQKSGTAPKNGKASFGEEDDMGVGEEAATEEAAVGDGKYVKAKDLDQVCALCCS